MQLELIQFIREHSDWENLLKEKPYCLTITRDEMFGKKLIMFKYSQIDSDFTNEIVKESRGIILEDGTWEIISYPFRKFMNYGEPSADDIDWNSAIITEKIDGSLIKISRLGNDLLISTNGTIDAFKAPIQEQVGCGYSSFGEIVEDILKERLGQNYKVYFHRDVTYMFEMVSPWTRVVIPYPKADLFFLGYRDNKSLMEKSFLDNPNDFLYQFKTPRVFSFKSLKDCIQNASELPWDEEGYVVNDCHFHRVKVKSVAWIQVHHIKDNGNLSYARCLELARLNEMGEVLNYFPEYKQEMDRIKMAYEDQVRTEKAVWDIFSKKFDLKNTPRKDLALWILGHTNFPAAYFSMLDRRVNSIEEWFQTCNVDKLVEMLHLK